jgi:3-methyladenine DNA glycosylase AlkD
MCTADALAETLEARLRMAGAPARAEHEKAYLKSELTHLGTSVPAVRAVVRQLRRERPALGYPDLLALVEALWRRPVHECRMAAVELLVAYGSLLRPGDLGLVERLLRQARTWALVDPLAERAAGAVVARCGDDPAVGSRLDRWSVDPDFWMRRAALLALLPSVRRGAEVGRFLRYADAMLAEREFFVRKAIGWVLRELGKRQPDLVAGWLAPRLARTSGVTLQEAVKYLHPEQRAALLRTGPGARQGRSASRSTRW